MHSTNLLAKHSHGSLSEMTGGSYIQGEHDTNLDLFQHALESKNIEYLEPLFQKEVEPDLPTLYALIKTFPSMRDEIIERYHTLCDVSDEDGKTLIHLAAQDDNADLLEFFAQNDTPLEDADTDGRNALHIAAMENSYNFILTFLGLKPKLINHLCDALLSTPLHYAVQYKSNEAAEALINYEADINAKNDERMTPLHLATKGNCEKIIQMLLEAKNIDVNALDDYEKSPLHYAAQKGNVETATALIEHGAQIDLQDCDGNTPLHIAIIKGHVDIIKYLVDKGASLYKKNKNGHCPLQLELEYNREDVFKHITGNYNAEAITQGTGGIPPHIVHTFYMRNNIVKNCPEDTNQTKSIPSSPGTESYADTHAPQPLTLHAEEELQRSSEEEKPVIAEQ